MYAAAASAHRPGQRAPPAMNPLRHLAHLQGYSLLMDLKGVHPTYNKQERHDFVIKELKIPANDVLLIFPDHITELVVLTLETKEVYDAALGRLLEGVPWAAAGGQLVFGSAADEAVASVRISNIPIGLASSVLLGHMRKFGTILTHRQGKDRLFPRASDGILHLTMVLNDEENLPHFIQVVDNQGRLANSLPVHLDTPRRRCYRCGRPNHLGRRCQAASRAPDAPESTWSKLLAPPPPGGEGAATPKQQQQKMLPPPPPPPLLPVKEAVQPMEASGGLNQQEEEMDQQAGATPSRKRALATTSLSSLAASSSDQERETQAEVEKPEPEFGLDRRGRKKARKRAARLGPTQAASGEKAAEGTASEVDEGGDGGDDRERVDPVPLATASIPQSTLESLVLTPEPRRRDGRSGQDGGDGGT